MKESSLQFLITLQDTNPKVWRRILIPENYNFYQFHMAIQGAFGWSNCHLFQFCENDIMDEKIISIPYEDMMEGGIKVKHAKSKLVRSVFKKRADRYSYIYDFGDDWLHEVIFEKKVTEAVAVPYCIESANACPPDDVGGTGGYEQMKQAFIDNDMDEIESYCQWLGLEKGERWRPDFCSRREINLRLALLVADSHDF